MNYLALVIPAYNEEKRIGNTLKEYVNFFKRKYEKNFLIYVVLNGCKDNTLSIVKEYSKKYPQIKYLNVKGKIGKGGAIIQGFKNVDGKLIGFVDADCSTKPEAFNELIENINNYNGVIASRWSKGAKINKKQKFIRLIASRVFNIMVRLLFFMPYTDTQCGAKLFKGNSLKKIVPKLGLTTWGFDIDLLYLFKRNKMKIKEIPTEWHDSEDSKLKVGKTSLEMFLSIIRLRLVYSPFRFIVKIYDVVFGSG